MEYLVSRCGLQGWSTPEFRRRRTSGQRLRIF